MEDSADTASCSSSSIWMSPSREGIWVKYDYLQNTLSRLEARGLTGEAAVILATCRNNLSEARKYFDLKWYQPSHPHLAWQFMHRVDEDIIKLIPDAEVLAKGLETKIYFDLNITENKLRDEWLGKAGGEKGQLALTVKKLEEDIATAVKVNDSYRSIIQSALNAVNQQVDRTFWNLSQNTLTSVLSGFLLIVFIVLSWYTGITSEFASLDSYPEDNLRAVALLGLIGTCLSNIVTCEGFLFVPGGAYWRYLLYHVIIKPALGAAAAVFIYLLAHANLIFSIVSTETGSDPTGIIILKVAEESISYVYCVLAVASGFAADKLIRVMMDSVLKKLAQSAEKTKEPPAKS